MAGSDGIFNGPVSTLSPVDEPDDDDPPSTLSSFGFLTFRRYPWDDATWILTSSFIIFTMQSGFGLLESGLASQKNETNIMVKNAIDVIFGGISYWLLGYGFSFGNEPGSNKFCGIGFFAIDVGEDAMGEVFSHFLFQASFATTATTIVSGAMAERCKLEAYIIFSFLNTFIFCFPAHWVWARNGWLKELHVVDIAGDGPVHLVGGVTALIAAIMLKPRIGRFTDGDEESRQMGSPTNAILGMFMLWWGWLGFNCGSTFGISGGKWKLAARAAVSTILSSVAGGMSGIFLSYFTKKKKILITFLINGILGSLVSITGMCALARPWESFIIGSVGATIACFGDKLLVRFRIDDPVSAVPIHCFCSIWGLIAVGIFGRKDNIANEFSQEYGLVSGGGFYLLGVQLAAILSIILWTVTTAFICLKLIDKVVGLRCSVEHEILGADFVHHHIKSRTPVPRNVVGETLSVFAMSGQQTGAINIANDRRLSTDTRDSGKNSNDSVIDIEPSYNKRRKSSGSVRMPSPLTLFKPFSRARIVPDLEYSVSTEENIHSEEAG